MNTLILYLSVMSLSGICSLLYAGALASSDRGIVIKYKDKEIRTANLKRIIYIAICTAPMIYLLSIRKDVGTDFTTYKLIYTDYTKWNIGRIEIGAKLLFSLANRLGWGFQGFLFLSALISVAGGLISIRLFVDNFRRLPIVFLIYLLIYFGPMCNIITQMIALPFVIAALWCVDNRKPIRFVLLCSTGILFHTATVTILPIYWIYHNYRKSRTKIVIGSIVVICVCIAAFPSILQNMLSGIPIIGSYARYISLSHVHTFRYMFIYRLPIYIVEAFYYRAVSGTSEKSKIMYFCLILEIAAMIMGIGTAWIGRVCYFFSFSHAVISGEIIDNQKYAGIRAIVAFLFVLYFAIAFGMMHFYSGFDGISSWG